MEGNFSTPAQQAIYKILIMYPAWSTKQIAEHLNVSEALVYKVKARKKKISLVNLPQKMKEEAIETANDTTFAIKKIITNYVELRTQKKQVLVEISNGKYEVTEIEQTPLEKSDLLVKELEARIMLRTLKLDNDTVKVMEWLSNQKQIKNN